MIRQAEPNSIKIPPIFTMHSPSFIRAALAVLRPAGLDQGDNILDRPQLVRDPAAIEGVFTRRDLATDDGRADHIGGALSHLGCLGAWLPSVFHAKFAYETIVHANRSFMPIDFPLGCFDPCAASSALAILQLA
jgi:hypothetical protein